MIPFFACTESQEFNSDIGVRNGTRQRALGPILRHYLTLLPALFFGHVIPFFACIESQEYNSDISVHNGMRHYALGPIFRH